MGTCKPQLIREIRTFLNDFFERGKCVLDFEEGDTNYSDRDDVLRKPKGDALDNRATPIVSNEYS